MRKWYQYLPSRRWLVFPPILVGVAAIVYLTQISRPLPRVDPVEQALRLQVVNVRAEALVPFSSGFGTAQPVRTWSAIAEVKGQVKSVHPNLESGTWVKAQDELVVIDDQDYQLRLSQRQSELASAKAQLAELTASQAADSKSLKIEQDLLALNQQEVKRFEKLLATRAVSPSDLDQVKGVALRQSQAVQQLINSISLYPARIAAAEASVALAKNRVSEAKRDIARTQIRAPFTGVLSGANVEAQQFVAQGATLFDVLDATQMEVAAQFSLSQLGRLASPSGSQSNQIYPATEPDRFIQQLTATVVARSGEQEFRYSGIPVRISESIDEQTRTLGLVVQVSNVESEPGEAGEPIIRRDRPLLRPGTFCEVILSGKSLPDMISVPVTSLEGDSVFLLDEDNRLKRVPVTLGARYGDRVVVLRGLTAGDRLIIEPPIPSVEGQLVVPRGMADSNESATSTATPMGGSNTGGAP